MEGFTAEDAKRIVESIQDKELNIILGKIRDEAEKGKTVLHVYHSLNERTRKELELRGFEVIYQSSIAIQVDKLFYSIYWK